ncbi:amidohydrolase/deacetylase family metallohydrolase [Nibrella viscosa]
MQKRYIVIALLCLFCTAVTAQMPYSLVIKGGHLIDPKNNINEVMDVAITDGRVVQIAKNIDATGAKQVVAAKGLYVTPGLIDIHGHVFSGTEPNSYLSNGLSAIMPDGFTFRVGVTTIVDAGGAGWKSFPAFKKNIIFNSKTRVLSFINIVGEGMRGGVWEQDTTDMDPRMAAAVALSNPNDIVGFKLAHFQGQNWTPVQRVVEAGKLANMPVIIDFGGSTPPLPLEDLFLKYLRPGDIFTHTYTLLENNVRETIVDEESGQVRPFVWEARKKGIVFDVGYGGASFNYSQAIPAMKSGFHPTTISTDLHTGSMNGSMKDMLSVMSKFLGMGMDLPAVIRASTWIPAQVIHRENLGHLSVGAIADVAILNLRDGKFGFYDKTGYKVDGKKKFECEMTIKGGKIVYDLNGIANPIVLR